METWFKRLTAARNKMGLRKAELARRVGVSGATVSDWESGVMKPRGDNLLKLCRVLCQSERWLMYGTEKVRLEAKKPPSEKSAEHIGGLVEWDDSTPLEDDQVELPYYTNVELSAGNGSSLCEEHSDRKLRFSKITLKRQGVDPSNASCVRVCGDSMSPLLPDGATVGVDTANTRVVDGKMYAIEHEGMLRIKTLYNVPGGGLRLRSFNEAEYPDEIYRGGAKQVKVLGKVFWYSVLL